MKDINKFIAENKETAKNQLMHIKGYLIEFNSDENNYQNNERPSVLLCDGNGEIYDEFVSKVRLNPEADMVMEIYIDEWEEWIPVDDCLSTTENNVYEAINDKVPKCYVVLIYQIIDCEELEFKAFTFDNMDDTQKKFNELVKREIKFAKERDWVLDDENCSTYFCSYEKGYYANTHTIIKIQESE